jgi:hypothetical protein
MNSLSFGSSALCRCRGKMYGFNAPIQKLRSHVTRSQMLISLREICGETVHVSEMDAALCRRFLCPSHPRQAGLPLSRRQIWPAFLYKGARFGSSCLFPSLLSHPADFCVQQQPGLYSPHYQTSYAILITLTISAERSSDMREMVV